MVSFIYCQLLCFVILLARAAEFDENSELALSSEEPSSKTRCDGPGSNPFQNSAFNGRCNCKKNVRGKFCDECKPNTFFMDYKNHQGCLRCYCSGKAKNCQQSTWFRESIVLSFKNDAQGVHLVFKNLSAVTAAPSVSEDGNEVYVDNLPSHSDETYYWKLPEAFLGDKISSYGGFINYTINYDTEPITDKKVKWLKNPLVFIQGNGMTLFYRFHKRNRKVTTNYLPLIASYWYKLGHESETEDKEKRKRGNGDRRGKAKKRKRAKRKEMMEVLSDVKFILIKANYKEMTQRVGLMNVTMSNAMPNGNTNELANSVEECECPEGYGGLSCQYCASGYFNGKIGALRSPQECLPCHCNGHSDICDPNNGKCLNCLHSTTGDHCEQTLLSCDQRGSFPSKPGAQHCKCKARVTGDLCDTCKVGNFHLDAENEKGCKKCWCSRVTFKCSSSTLRRFQIKMQKQLFIKILYFNIEFNQWYHRPVEVKNGKASFFKKHSIFTNLYWSLPKTFRGNLLKSYGGNLYFSMTNEGSPTCPEQSVLHPFLELESFSGIRLWWKFKPVLRMMRLASFSVKLTEEHFVFYNTTVESTRPIFLQVLTSLKTIKVKVPECAQITTEIGNIILDTAISESFADEFPLASEVEMCDCPTEYTGLSCEFCAIGYIKDSSTKRCVRKWKSST